MAEYLQVRLNPDVREQLDSYKMDGESYSIAIGRLFKERDSLLADKEQLMKIAMQTEDSIAFLNLHHSVIFAVIEVLKMENQTDEDKIKSLKIYLRPCLKKNPSQVYSIINGFKDEYDEFSSILEELSSWIQDLYEF